MPEVLPGRPTGAVRGRTGGRAGARALPAALLGGAVLAQVAYPLTPDRALTGLSVAVVLLAAAGAVAHVAVTLGGGAAARYTAVAVGTSLAAEAVGVATGWPFGDYAYTASLGARVLDVPLVVPLAWTMMAWPCLVAARRLVRGLVARVAVGAWALAAWDVFLDPQLVDAGHWTWLDARVVVPGSPGVPVSNTVGWLVVGAVLVAALERLLPEGPDDAAAPLAFLVWTWVGSTLAAAVFFGRPVTALLGALALGAVVVPLLVREDVPGRLRRLAGRRSRPDR